MTVSIRFPMQQFRDHMVLEEECTRQKWGMARRAGGRQRLEERSENRNPSKYHRSTVEDPSKIHRNITLTSRLHHAYITLTSRLPHASSTLAAGCALAERAGAGRWGLGELAELKRLPKGLC